MDRLRFLAPTLIGLLVPYAVESSAADEKNAPAPRPAIAAYKPELAKKAIEKSLPMLWEGVDGHSDKRTCFTCHHHAVPLLAFATAKSRGFDIEQKRIDELEKFIIDDLDSHRERLKKGQGPGPQPAGGGVDNTGYALFALDAVGHKPDDTTAITAKYHLGEMARSGHWFTPAGRAPTEASSFTTTALSLKALNRYGTKEDKEKIAKRIEAAMPWVLKTKPADNEDRVFRLVGLREGGAEDDTVATAIDDLLATQRADGGWSQTDKLTSDAYATGTALYSLHTAGKLPTTDSAYRRGLLFLLRNQEDDGTWHVATRSRPFQRYFETGFPHGKDQFISCAASAWATTALALALPIPK